MGAESQTFSVDWNAIDLGSDGNGDPIFAGGEGSELLALANACYPNSNTRISMMLRPITTLAKMAPPGFENLPFDSPAMIERFEQTLDQVFGLIPDLEITSLAIGSEIDLYLTTASLRDEWAVFYAAVAGYARDRYQALYPAKAPLLVTTEVSHKAMLDPALISYYMDLHSHSDSIGISYYPLENSLVQSPDRVALDFSDLVAQYGTKPLIFFQLGYPSGYFDAGAYDKLARGDVMPSIGSSETMQGDFIDAVFEAWDSHGDTIRLISFTWMNDETEADVAQTIANPAFGGGVTPTPEFVEFLRTLGLRTESGAAKAAFTRLASAASARGWADGGESFGCNQREPRPRAHGTRFWCTVGEATGGKPICS